MNFTNLLGPQTPTRKKKPSDSVPEVFIIESLELEDEVNARREGEVLAAVLRMAVAFWSSFYVKTFSRNARAMHSDRIAELLRPLAALFNEPVHFSRANQRGKWVHEIIEG